MADPPCLGCPGSLGGPEGGSYPCCRLGRLGTCGRAVRAVSKERIYYKDIVETEATSEPWSDRLLSFLFPSFLLLSYVPPLSILSQPPALLPPAFCACFPCPLFVCSWLSFFPSLCPSTPPLESVRRALPGQEVGSPGPYSPDTHVA